MGKKVKFKPSVRWRYQLRRVLESSADWVFRVEGVMVCPSCGLDQKDAIDHVDQLCPRYMAQQDLLRLDEADS